jgi:hypothetical protein
MMQQIVDTYRQEDMPIAVHVGDGMLHVTLGDQRVIATPLNWYPKLMQATPEQLINIRLSASGIHFPDLDEDLSIEGMLFGNHSR